MSCVYYFVINDYMLEMVGHKYVYWLTDHNESFISRIPKSLTQHALIGYSDLVVECIDNDPPEIIKDIRSSFNLELDENEWTYIKLSSIDLRELVDLC